MHDLEPTPVITDAEGLNWLPDRTLARLEPTAADVPALCVVKLDGELHALADRCPHRGVPLSEGFVDDVAVTCGAHGLRFDLRTGKSAQGFRGTATPYSVAVRDGQISVSRVGRGWFRLWSRRRHRAADDRRMAESQNVRRAV